MGQFSLEDAILGRIKDVAGLFQISMIFQKFDERDVR